MTESIKELGIKYEKEVIVTSRKLQLIDFVHFYYENMEEMTFGQIVDEFRKTH